MVARQAIVALARVCTSLHLARSAQSFDKRNRQRSPGTVIRRSPHEPTES